MYVTASKYEFFPVWNKKAAQLLFKKDERLFFLLLKCFYLEKRLVFDLEFAYDKTILCLGAKIILACKAADW